MGRGLMMNVYVPFIKPCKKHKTNNTNQTKHYQTLYKTIVNPTTPHFCSENMCLLCRKSYCFDINNENMRNEQKIM